MILYLQSHLKTAMCLDISFNCQLEVIQQSSKYISFKMVKVVLGGFKNFLYKNWKKGKSF